MEKKELMRLIRKYQAGTCTPAEQKKLEAWWSSTLQDDSYKGEIPEFERNKLKQETLANLQWLIQTEKRKDNLRKLRPEPRVLTLVAACVALFVIVSAVLFNLDFSDETTISSKFGERLEVVLPDRSIAILNGNSSIRFSKWNDNEDRNVWLEGEAYFAVVHTKNNNRFIVNTQDSLKVEALGTQFVVSNRTGQTNVVLREGKVRLEKASFTCIMMPNEMASYSRATKRFVKRAVNANQKVSWKDNLLVFEDETLQSVADRLKASHGLIIRFKNESDAKEIFNGSIPGDSVQLLFEKIETLYQLRVTRSQDGIYIVE